MMNKKDFNQAFHDIANQLMVLKMVFLDEKDFGKEDFSEGKKAAKKLEEKIRKLEVDLRRR